MKKIISALVMFLVVLMIPSLTAKADGETKIYTADDLLKVAENPSGSYVLMNDIDMKDVEWKPVDFSGTFDGNSHAILNLYVKDVSDSTRITYDGNYKTYDTYFAGLFGVLENAEVKNLNLYGVKVEIDNEVPTFAAPLAGFAEGSKVSNCNIEGVVRLDANAKMFGVGGMIGYGGSSSLTEVNTDVILVCIDKDAENRDEQFMGGGYAAGYIDVDKCSVKIHGFDSDHGYVHDGGLVGMYILYPLGTDYAGYINNTRVEGIITFFEDNTDRRAYCKDFCGEVMNWTYEYVGNSSAFTRDEVKDYSTNLLPFFYKEDAYNEEKVEGSCEEYGYTKCTSDNADGLVYKKDYTLKNHSISEYTDEIEATYDTEGLAKGVCSNCGEEVYITTPVKEPEPEVIEEVVEPVEETPSEDAKPAEKSDDKFFAIVLIAGLVISACLVGGIAFVLLSGGKKRKR